MDTLERDYFQCDGLLLKRSPAKKWGRILERVGCEYCVCWSVRWDHRSCFEHVQHRTNAPWPRPFWFIHSDFGFILKHVRFSEPAHCLIHWLTQRNPFMSSAKSTFHPSLSWIARGKQRTEVSYCWKIDCRRRACWMATCVQGYRLGFLIGWGRVSESPRKHFTGNMGKVGKNARTGKASHQKHQNDGGDTFTQVDCVIRNMTTIGKNTRTLSTFNKRDEDD